jgi:hypothetical protein
MGPEYRCRPWASERRVTCQALEENASEGVEVGATVGRRASDLLGRDVLDRPREVAGLRYLGFRSDLLGQAEVREVAVLAASLVRYEDVPWLHVAVDETMGMGCVKGVGSLRDEA